ncbi:hypothetical protein KPL70_017091 [Citrus sinensis]|nr:hypothetical protein KPL70_017091 [Citrus sinensis]
MGGLRLLALVVVTVAVVHQWAVGGGGVMGNFVFEVENKFKAGGERERTLSALKQHDTRRHGRMMASIDLELGGNGHPSATGLYFTKVGLGTPTDEYYVQVDTGSDLLWVNCAGCSRCPTKSDLGIKLTLFDPSKSSTSGEIACSDNFCRTTYNNRYPSCSPGVRCEYVVTYGDGSSTSGYFVRDIIQLNQASGNLKTAPLNSSVIFGCGNRQSGDLGSSTDAAVDGILGFGQANSSLLSQLAAAGNVRKEFAHCLDVVKGGGIFAIGDVVSPKVKTTPMVPNMPHYNVILEEVEVGGNPLDLPTSLLGTGDERGTIIDSGTTLAYLPPMLYDLVLSQVAMRYKIAASKISGLLLSYLKSQYSVDDAFPTVTFKFKGSLSLTVYPHEYLFQIREDVWCIGWQNGGLQNHDGRQMILLGGTV